jgi:hypothetical protein
MSRKIRIIALAIFTLMAIGAYAADLNEGYYQASGTIDQIHILPNHENIDKSSRKIPNNWTTSPLKGAYAVIGYMGSPKNKQVMYRGTGTVNTEGKLLIRVQYVSNDMKAVSKELTGTELRIGTLLVFEIYNSRTFYDVNGAMWYWISS